MVTTSQDGYEGKSSENVPDIEQYLTHRKYSASVNCCYYYHHHHHHRHHTTAVIRAGDAHTHIT